MKMNKAILCAALLSGYAPLFAQNVGIGQANPISKLDISGNVTVGTSYSGVTAAPANGMNIQGRVVIGAASLGYPNDRLESYESGAAYCINGYITGGLPNASGIQSASLYGSVAGTGGVGILIDHTATGDFAGLFNINQTGPIAAVKGDVNTGNSVHGVMGEVPTTGTPGKAIYANGNGYTTGAWQVPSDERLKHNILPYAAGLATVMQLQPVTYDFKPELIQKYNLSKGTQIGFLAQDLEREIPTMVDNVRMVAVSEQSRKGGTPAETMDAKAVNYDMLIPVLTKAIQEQQAQIETLQKQVNKLQEELQRKK